MKTSTMMPSKHLKQSDVPSPIVATIAGVEMREVGTEDNAETKAVMDFKEDLKSLVLNVTNITTLEMLYGDDSDQWIGKKIEIYSDPSIMYAGKRVGGLRVREPGQTPALAWTEAIKQCAAVGLTEDDVRHALKEAGLKNYNAGRDAGLIRTLIADAQGGGQGDEIPI
jgi:hypothetical protein